MNAQIRKRPVPAQALDAACPAEAIGRRSARLRAELQRLHELPLPDADTVQKRREDALFAAIEALDDQLEWTRPQTLAGIYVQLLGLRDLAHDMAFADGEHAKLELMARFDRLNILALDALEQLAGLDAEALGGRMRVYRPKELMEVLDQLG